jgi:KGK domain
MSVVVMNQQNFQALTNEEDVISVQEHNMHGHIHNYPMFKLADIVRKLSCKLVGMSETDWDKSNYQQKKWVTDGVKCEVLSISEGKWKKGKVKLKVILEFCPDEPTASTASNSPLDDLRG